MMLSFREAIEKREGRMEGDEIVGMGIYQGGEEEGLMEELSLMGTQSSHGDTAVTAASFSIRR